MKKCLPYGRKFRKKENWFNKCIRDVEYDIVKLLNASCQVFNLCHGMQKEKDKDRDRDRQRERDAEKRRERERNRLLWAALNGIQLVFVFRSLTHSLSLQSPFSLCVTCYLLARWLTTFLCSVVVNFVVRVVVFAAVVLVCLFVFA